MIADPARVLLVTLMDPNAPPGGREQLARLNARVLGALFGDGLTVHRLVKGPGPNLIHVARGHLNGLCAREIARIVARVEEAGAGQVFVDGSNLGQVVAPIKRAHPQVRIVTFCHNVEARFFHGAARAKRTALSLGLLATAWAAERRAVRHSDAIVCLSARDSDALRRLYGRGADHVSPLALEDALPSPVPAIPAHRERYLLFVGGAFYANRRGVEWFAREVAPRSLLPIAIVGEGMETLRDTLGGSLRIVGATDDLARWYLGAHCVVAPIFEGSGMKTKIAEALMFGKRIIGTREAYSGYGSDVVAAGWQADDAPAFLAAIAEAAAADLSAFDPAIRALYENTHSVAAATRRMEEIMLPGR